MLLREDFGYWEVRKMEGERTLGIVSFAIATALILLANPVAATLWVGGTGTGVTEVEWNGSCSADVSGSGDQNLDVRSGDDVIFYYEVSWDDDRVPPAGRATHNFTMIVSYSRLVGDLYAWKEVPTYGDGGGQDTLHITVYGVQPPATIGVVWLARITAPSCYDDDFASATIYLI